MTSKASGESIHTSTEPTVSLSKSIEGETGKTLSIETKPTPVNLAKCNPQDRSPIFSRLPAEIRDEIFSLVLLQHGGLEKRVPRRITSTDILLTCRRVWLEANHWPMLQAVHKFWSLDDERPSWVGPTERGRFSEFARAQLLFHRLTPTQAKQLRHIQILGGPGMSCGSGSCLLQMLATHDLRIDSFKITIRREDWTPVKVGWDGTRYHRLPIDTEGLCYLLCSALARNISQLRLELELPSEFGVDEKVTKLVESVKAAVEEASDIDMIPIDQPSLERTWSSPTITEVHAAVPEDRVCLITWKSCLDNNTAAVLEACQSVETMTASRADHDARPGSVEERATVQHTPKLSAIQKRMYEAGGTTTKEERDARISYERRWALEGSLLHFSDSIRPSQSDPSLAVAPEPTAYPPNTEYSPIHGRLMRKLSKRRVLMHPAVEHRREIVFPSAVPKEDTVEVDHFFEPVTKRRKLHNSSAENPTDESHEGRVGA